MSASPADPLGFDVYVGPLDLDPTGRSATGLELVEAAIVHRLTCEKIDLIDAPNGEIDFGVDVRKWVGEVTTPDDAPGKVPLIDEVLHRDLRIASTVVDVQIAPPGDALSDGSTVALLIYVTATTTTGAVIDRIVGVSAVSVEFLSQGK